DLAEIGFDCQWSRVSAKELGAPHKRDRLWLVGRNVRYTAGEGLPVRFSGQMERSATLTEPQRPGWWPSEPEVGSAANGLANWVAQIKALGN
ncbi:DNA cytosine methyltransferase, partial [Enterobacter hormaechei]